MKDDYSYLKDPRALAEIRKHKWIESQKNKTEIGFATAAVDWIKRYGLKWKEHHDLSDSNIFLERRKYRRFNINSDLKAIKDNLQFIAESVNVSFFGILFKTAKFLSIGSSLRVGIVAGDKKEDILDCDGVVSRVINQNDQYEIFLRFDEKCQQSMRDCKLIRNQ